MTDEAPKRRPFHEWIVDEIRASNHAQLLYLARPIVEVEIPKGHDAILAAWGEMRGSDGLPLDELDFAVVGALREQKAEAEEKAAERAKKLAVEEDADLEHRLP